jgi:peptidyl-prolyl cis-trans isomerase D
MLSFFRRGLTAKIMLGVLGLALFAIVITGFGTGGMGGLGELGGGPGTNDIATVGSGKITADRVRNEATRALERYRQQQPNLDMPAFIRQGALEDIVDQLISVIGAVSFGESNGLVASKPMVDKLIASDPAFQGAAGQFDENAFRTALFRLKMTEDQVREQIHTQLIDRELMLPAVGSPYVPSSLAGPYASLLLESRTGMVGAVPTKAMDPGPPPSDAEVAAYFQRNIARYTYPQRRVVRYALFGAENVAAQSQASEAEIAAAYARNPAYRAKDLRTLQQVVLQDEKAARAFAAKVAAGTSFADAARQAGFAAADIAIGDKSREDFARTSAPEVAAAAFAAAKGATVGPIRSALGWHVVRVADVKTVAAKPLAAVRGDIAAQIGKAKALAALSALASRIDNATTGTGAGFADIVKRENLTAVETPPVTATGQAPEAPAGWTAPPELTPILQGAFQMEPNDPPAVQPVVPNQKFALISTVRILPAAAPPLAQIRDRVRTDLMAQRASDKGLLVARAIVAKIDAGTPPAQAFVQAGVRLPPLQTITATRQDVAKQGQNVPRPLAMLFNLPRGKARLVAAPDARGWFIVYLDKIVPGDASKQRGLAQMVRSQFAQAFSDEYAQQFMASIRAGLTVKRNAQALARLRAELNGSAPPS